MVSFNKKLGIIYLSYGRPELEEAALNPFIELKKDGICKIAAISSIFPEYIGLIEDNITFKRLQKKKTDGEIDFLFGNSDSFKEFALRTVALKQLLDCELILLWDADEMIDKNSIYKILNFADRNSDIYYFDLAFRQFFRDEKHHIGVEYFKRLFRNFKNDNLAGLYFDCDFFWESGDDREKPRMRIPENIATVNHLSWLNSNAKAKIAYQEKHFGHGMCSYKWDDEKNSLELNLDFYQKFGKVPPIVYEL